MSLTQSINLGCQSPLHVDLKPNVGFGQLSIFVFLVLLSCVVIPYTHVFQLSISLWVRPGKKRDCFAQKACLESPKSVKKRDLKNPRSRFLPGLTYELLCYVIQCTLKSCGVPMSALVSFPFLFGIYVYFPAPVLLSIRISQCLICPYVL